MGVSRPCLLTESTDSRIWNLSHVPMPEGAHAWGLTLINAMHPKYAWYNYYLYRMCIATIVTCTIGVYIQCRYIFVTKKDTSEAIYLECKNKVTNADLMWSSDRKGCGLLPSRWMERKVNHWWPTYINPTTEHASVSISYLQSFQVGVMPQSFQVV